jgi:hypothetical protein
MSRHSRQAHTANRNSRSSYFFVFLIYLTCAGLQANPLAPPGSESLLEAKQLVNAMQNNAKGPYKRILWYCKDGTKLPPRSFACKDHGGGHQHAEYSSERERLAKLGWNVGTIFTALSWDEFWDASNNHYRLRELPIEQYLIQIDDGWVLHQARYYRGRVQIEDEEEFGRKLLLRLLSDSDWIDNNYLLVKELVKVIPHSGGEDLTQSIRRTAQNIAESEAKFEKLRIEVHTTPSARTSTHIRQWLATQGNIVDDKNVLAEAEKLAKQLDTLYGEEGRVQRLQRIAKKLAANQNTSHLTGLITASNHESELSALEQLCNLLVAFRNTTTTNIEPELRLQIFDIYPDIEAEIRLKANLKLQDSGLSRRSLLMIVNALAHASYGTGLLTKNELSSINSEINTVLAANELPVEDYYQASRIFNLASNWAIGTVRHTFAQTLINYTALNSHAAKYVDDVIRGSVMFPYAEVAKIISIDAQINAGIQHKLFKQQSNTMLGLNPGLAVGKLRIVSDEDLNKEVSLARDEIVVLPQTVSELAPVAGVLTYGEGNLLSHVQMLARNFGIPNVALAGTNLEQLSNMAGQEVLLIVGTDGTVVLQAFNDLDEKQRELLTNNQKNNLQSVQLDVPQPDLSINEPIEISNLHKELSGKVVGPKAANLGELNRIFPGRVAPAIALPFGVYAEHINSQPIEAKAKLKTIYENYRKKDLSESEFNQKLDVLRTEIVNSKVSIRLQSSLAPMMQKLFGEPGTYGLFIRSDTNVEDLPGFTGAGLSETVPNVVGLETQMQTIPKVWASVLSPRAIAWRSNLLKQPDEVYASILLMKSVAAEKSGVLVTSNLFSKQKGITISTAWGVGGAVSGEAAETIVLLDNQKELLISEAKAPYQRSLTAKGGISWLPAVDGAVLTEDEKQQLRELNKEVNEKYEKVYNTDLQPLPWDIEFGFVKGELTLFQIRPLIERGQVLADKVLSKIVDKKQSNTKTVSILETLSH